MMNTVSGDFKIYCPLDDNSREVDPQEIGKTSEWIVGFDLVGGSALVSHFSNSGANMPPTMFPNMTPVQCRDFSDYTAWLLIWDDLFDSNQLNLAGHEKINLCFSMVSVLERPEHNLLRNFKYAKALLDIALRIKVWATAEEYAFFLKTFEQWMLSYIWGETMRGGFVDLSVDLYHAHRLRNVACDIMLFMGETSNQIFLTESERQDKLIRAITESCSLIVTLDNDLYSRAKSKLKDEAPNDLADMYVKIGKFNNEADSIVHVVNIRDQAMNLYLKLRKKILLTDNNKLRKYIVCCDDCIVGNILYGSNGVRYFDPDNMFSNAAWDKNIRSQALFVSDIDAISWWWEL
ncbi:terpene synthase family protein [Burkholderia cenocepacia]|uniref:terpene synthase family protein n=1 Tax=Burkholderia cenocepacia TaxID=95486 RepID=UPI0023B95F51|nr:hypothetical protein [Burkholderia cenocepacia]